MKQMSQQNLDHIKAIFTEKTGVELKKSRRGISVRKLAVLAAAVLCCFALAGFGYPLFSPLNADELSLSATYEGGGVVSILVKNGSDKELRFQEQTKLVSWVTGEEVPRQEGEIRFENICFPAHSSGIMTVDLSQAYDIEALEQDGKNFQVYYLLLTNNDFLFGHDWICSFPFSRENPQETEPLTLPKAEHWEQAEEALQFYFREAYQEEVLAWNEKNFQYLQKVAEMIRRFDGQVVPPVSPSIQVSGPSVLLEPQPRIETQIPGLEGMALSQWTMTDGYQRLICGAASEKALAVMAYVPMAKYPDAVSAIPLRYTLVYEAALARKENHTFFYGRFYSFEQLEESKVYEDAYYAIYDITDYLYRDLDAYLDDLQRARPDLVLDSQVRAQLQSVYEDYRDHLGERITY